MPTIDYTEKVLEIQDVEIKKIEKTERVVVIHIEQNRRERNANVRNAEERQVESMTTGISE